ncbi:hypothetical protein BU24DRAFT_119759 [Aaosphaeria arxii CBS 175.79]|uniref:Uncharacterized protein n=1 Tax=Aaosphaeria arxii CBS 175.79 TaxID=1450172 RepID=A0A6A5Y2H1_9PLEO|nr:uncharacterized protein BU24DRAFT_119759 [Aaosphaeria arxii CBS 175.79]KAF2019423.1 hypothetical protein BU24DRAFT_119759 [Aaosphaeria arxii CBS 175.79]
MLHINISRSRRGVKDRSRRRKVISGGLAEVTHCGCMGGFGGLWWGWHGMAWYWYCLCMLCRLVAEETVGGRRRRRRRRRMLMSFGTGTWQEWQKW